MQFLHNKLKKRGGDKFNKFLHDIKKHYSQQSLAMKLHIDQSTLSRKLNGKTKMTVEEAVYFAECVGYPVEAICNYCEVKKRLNKHFMQ